MDLDAELAVLPITHAVKQCSLAPPSSRHASNKLVVVVAAAAVVVVIAFCFCSETLLQATSLVF